MTTNLKSSHVPKDPRCPSTIEGSLTLGTRSHLQTDIITSFFLDFPSGAVVKNPPANAADERDVCSIPGSGRSLGGGNGNPLQYYCLENSMDRGAWWAVGHWVAQHSIAEGFDGGLIKCHNTGMP